MDQLESPGCLNIHPKVHKAAQDHKDCRNPLPWRLPKSRARTRPSQRPRWARGRLAGLPQAGRPSNCATDARPTVNRLHGVIRATVRRSVAMWQDPQAGQPRGGRPAPLGSLSGWDLVWKLSTTVIPAFNRRYLQYRSVTDLGRI